MLATLAMAPLSAYAINRNAQPHLTIPVMKRKLCLHGGTVTVDSNKNRLVEIPPCAHQSPDYGLRRIPASASNATTCIAKNGNVHFYVNCTCAIAMSDLLLPQNGIMLELRRIAVSQNRCSCQFQTNGLKGVTTTKRCHFVHQVAK